MNLKFSMHIVFSFVVSSCFAFNQDMTQQEIRYNQEGIHTITKLIFDKRINDASETYNNQFYFTAGLTRFCQEKGIKKNDLIAKVPNTEFAGKPVFLFAKELLLCNPSLPITALLRRIDSDQAKNFSMIFMTPEMEKFVQEMIEKGKSVNQVKN